MSRKARQLAKQAERALAFAISEIADAEIASAMLLMVEPAPDASRLAVTIQAAPGVAVERVEDGVARGPGSCVRAQRELVRIVRKLEPVLTFRG